MIEAQIYPQETERLAALTRLHLLDTPIEERFERITRMLCRLLNVPIAIFNLIDAERQHYKSVQGLDVINAARKDAFCTHTLHEDSMLLVPNAKNDDRFHDNPFVTGQYLNIGFYAGVPVRSPEGMPVGTLCAIDTKPREMSADELDTLRDLAAMVETELKMIKLSHTQQNLMEELDKAQREALVDSLTRLWNREGIKRILEREWSEAIRQKKPVTIVMTDIDHFKKINDTFGHPVGDAVLKNASRKLLECLRGEDALGRVGGEEFLMLLTDCEPNKVFETVDRIRHTIATTPLLHHEDTYDVTMSFGVATITPSQGDTIEQLIKRADDALYKAKNGGRNRVEIAV